MNHFKPKSQSPTQPHTPTRTCSSRVINHDLRLHMEARCHSSEPIRRDNFHLPSIGFLNHPCLCFMRHIAKRDRTWNISIKCSYLNAGHDCCPHWVVRLQQNRLLSLVLCLFSRPTLRVSQNERLSSFRGTLPSNLVINLHPGRYKTCCQTGTQSYGENVTQQKQSRGICQERENNAGWKRKS